MKNRKLLILSLVTTVAILAAIIISRQNAPTSSLEKEPLFPELETAINKVSKLELKTHNKTLTLSQSDKVWQIKEADGYPADFGKIRESVIGVSGLRVISEKTSNPDLYEKLGVRNPDIDGSNSLLLSLLDEKGGELAKLIVGQSRRSKSAGSKQGLYVRLPDSDTALLVEGELNVSADVKDWFDRDLFDIDASRVKKITIAHNEGDTVMLSRENDVDDFILHNIPEGREAQSNVTISRMGTLLEDIFVDNVVRAESLSGKESSTTSIDTFDGIQVKIVNAQLDDTNYSSFDFSILETDSSTSDSESTEAGNEDNENNKSPAEEVEGLNKRLSGWAYAIPDFKFELFNRSIMELSRETQSSEDSDSSTDE